VATFWEAGNPFGPDFPNVMEAYFLITFIVRNFWSQTLLPCTAGVGQSAAYCFKSSMMPTRVPTLLQVRSENKQAKRDFTKALVLSLNHPTSLCTVLPVYNSLSFPKDLVIIGKSISIPDFVVMHSNHSPFAAIFRDLHCFDHWLQLLVGD
jgi:hypothetical protein